MSSQSWSDEELVAELRRAAAAARDVPNNALEIGRMAFAWRSVDQDLELLALVHDSSVQRAEGVRGDGAQAPRMLVFESESLTLEVEVGADTVMGHVVPALPGRLLMVTREREEIEGETDDGGFFLLQRPHSSPVRLTWLGREGQMSTDWFPI